MPLYPLKKYVYIKSSNLDVNLENLFMFHKYQLLKCYIYAKPLTISEHNGLIDTTNETVDVFKEDIDAFMELTDVEIKWQWIGKIRLEQHSILEKSAAIINKLHLQ